MNAGVAILELAITIPFLLLLFIGGVELTRALYTQTALIGFARETAVDGFRKSAGLASAPAAGKLQEAIDQTWGIFDREFPGSTVRLRLVRYGVRSPSVIWNLVAEVVKHGTGVAPAERQSRLGTIDAAGNSTVMNDYFRPTNSAEFPRRDRLLADQQDILLAEFYYPYRSIVPGLGQVFGFSGGLLYVRIEL